MKVIKRDGREVQFDKNKITNALTQAFIEVDKELTEEDKIKINNITDSVFKIVNNKTISVEEIQDIVEQKLMTSNRKDVAKVYIIYRNDRNKIREQKSELMKNISEKLMAANVQNQNANVDEKSFGGRIGAASDEVMKKYALDNYDLQ